MKAYIFEHPVLSLISKPHMFKANLSLHMFQRLAFFQILHLLGVIQYFKNPLGGNKGGLDGSKLIRDLGNGLKELLHQSNKGI